MKTLWMKRLGFSLIATLLMSCGLEPNHSMRVKNTFTETFADVTLNSTSYGRIEVGATTDYKHIEKGNFKISGSTESGRPFTGSGKVTGGGKHKWTMTITSSGDVSFHEDK